MPPKRAVFSLNIDSNADHVHQRVEDHSKEGTDRIKVFDSEGPTHGHTDLSYVTKPFEKAVNKAVDDVIEGSGKKVHSVEGDLHYTTEKSASGTDSTLRIKNKTRKRALERKYDTSEL